MALFAPTRQSQSQNLVEFRAGKLSLNTTTNMVHPDKRKGLVYISLSDDGLMHFCWKDRNTGTVEEDLIVFPEDAEFLPVKACTTGRVFLLRMKGTGRKHFFWMQEPKTEKDEEYHKKVNDLLNRGPSAVNNSSTRGGDSSSSRQGSLLAGLGGDSSISPDQLALMQQVLGGIQPGGDMSSSSLGNVDQNQLMQLLGAMGAGGQGLGGAGGAVPNIRQLFGRAAASNNRTNSGITDTPNTNSGGATGANASAGSGSAGGRDASSASNPNSGSGSRQVIGLNDLQSILANIVPQGGQDELRQPFVNLDEALTDKGVVESVTSAEASEARLLPHLPSDEPVEQDRAELRQSLESPQFRQAAGTFGVALQTGELGPLLRQFDLPGSAVEAAEKGDLKGFAQHLEKAEKDGQTSAHSEKKEDPAKKKGEDDTMELD